GPAAHTHKANKLTTGVVAVGSDGNRPARNRSGKNCAIFSMSRFLVTIESSSRSLASDSESSSDVSNRAGLTEAGEGAVICAPARQRASNMTVTLTRK